MVKVIAYSFLIIGFHLQVWGQAQDYVFEQITSEAGITFNAVSSIVEDGNGFLWFGTASGLYHYNTSEIIKYNYNPLKDNSPPSNNITNLYKDKNGRIWICTDHSVCYFDESTNSFSRFAFRESDKFLNNRTVSYILQYSAEVYLIVIDELLYHFNMNEPVMREIKLGDQPHRVSFLGQMEDGQIYVGTTDGNVFLNQVEIANFFPFYRSTPNPVTSCL